MQCFEITEVVTTCMSGLWYKLLLVILFYFRKLQVVLVCYKQTSISEVLR
jgi:hypothetical protein